MPGTLRPTAPIAADILLPADPGVALALAQELLARPRMANHHHGLWGYSGSRRDGAGELTIQATGLGGPSAAAVGADLIELGARRLIRIGSCWGPSGEEAAASVVARAAIADDGASRALGARGTVDADAAITAALLAAEPAARAVVVSGADIRPGPDGPVRQPDHEAPVADLETAALLALGESAGVAVGAILALAPLQVLDEPATEERLLALGRIASQALLERDNLVGEVVEPVLDRFQPS